MDIKKEHNWDSDGERCLDCGDKDWFAEPHCSNFKNKEKQKYEIKDEPDAWASESQLVGLGYKEVKYGKLPVQSLNPLRYKHIKLYSENKVIGLMKAYYYDGYTEAIVDKEKEIQSLRQQLAVRDLEVMQLREALKLADEFISNGVEFGYVKMPDADLKGIDLAHEVPVIIQEALSTTFTPDYLREWLGEPVAEVV